MSEKLKTINVAAGIIVKNKKILATQRGYGAYEGWWEFPGGKIEQNEEPEKALIREIKEELDADILIDRFFDITEHDYPEFHLYMECFLCSFVAEDIVLQEHSQAKWLGRDDIYSVKWLAADFPVIEKLIKEEII